MAKHGKSSRAGRGWAAALVTVIALAVAVPAFASVTVQPGDTLYGIAQRVLGNGQLWPELYAANRPVIGADPNLIQAGEQLQVPGSAPVPAVPATGSLSGTLGCAGLEQLWVQAGGSPSQARLMAAIAMAESGGRQFATGTAGEEGYWQILPSNGDASYVPILNAQAAVHILATQGLGAWTTWTRGLYAGRCLWPPQAAGQVAYPGHDGFSRLSPTQRARIATPAPPTAPRRSPSSARYS